jgi:hypothetical protein
VFHVQTEDSGILSPHLFTHLFHGGVIVSTRKLVYDSGAAEDAIKSLMQAQHKAVLKDLRRGVFDDKIDEYLGTTPGLEPRPDPAARNPPAIARASEPVIEAEPPVNLPDPTIDMSADRAPAAIDMTLRSNAPEGMATEPSIRTEDLTERVPPQDDDSSPEIEIRLELDDDETPEPGSGRRRMPHDTELQLRNNASATATANAAESDGIPMAVGKPAIPHLPDRRPGVGAAALPPARPITRPPARPAIQTPQVASRPVISDNGRRESDAIEIYSPPPPSAELPPSERPGEYMQTRTVRKSSHAIDTLPRERSGSSPIPSGLGPLPRPPLPPSGPPTPRNPISASGPSLPRPPSAKPTRVSDQIPKIIPPEPSPRADGVARSRVPTPPRVAPARTPSPASGSGGVVMTRPAVIVGAPAKSATPTRPRKAREDEGRGFGQGLISEKSLDEVILAYLSEDAEEK